MWFLIDPNDRKGLAESFLISIQTSPHFFFSWDDTFSDVSPPTTMNLITAKEFHKQFMDCDMARLGSSHGKAIAPHVAINHLDNNSSKIKYYAGPPDKGDREQQFLSDLPMIKAVYFFGEEFRSRLYITFALSDEAKRLPWMIYEDGRYFVERDS